jgi:MFS family permease
MLQSQAGTRHGLLLIAVAWLAPIGATLFAPVLPDMIRHFSHVPHADLLAPIAMVTPALMVALLAPLAGLLTDNFGRRRVLLTALVFYAAAGVAPYWIDNIYLIILSRCVVGIAEAGVMTASTALICDYFSGQRRSHWLSVQFGSAALVATVCFVLAGFLGGFNWRAPFLVYAATIVLAPLVLMMIYEPVRTSPPVETAATMAASDQALLTTRYVIGLLLTLACGMLFYVTPVHISLVLSERGFTDPAMLGLASAIGSVGVVAGATLFRFQSTRSIGSLLLIVMVAQAAGYAVLYTQPSLQGGIVGMFVNNIGCGISLPLVLAFTMSKLPDAYRGRASGLWTSAFFIGQFACPFFVAGLSALGGGMVATMGMLAGLTATAALVLLSALMLSSRLREPATAGPLAIATH